MRTFLLLLFSLTFALSACAPTVDEDYIKENSRLKDCAEPRLESSFQFHEIAKDYLASFYKTRKESELFFAWYASEDSLYMAGTIKGCFDKKNKHYHAMKNILKRNDVLRGLIVQNMRVDHQAKLSELFLEEYRKLFIRDIQ